MDLAELNSLKFLRRAHKRINEAKARARPGLKFYCLILFVFAEFICVSILLYIQIYQVFYLARVQSIPKIIVK